MPQRNHDTKTLITLNSSNILINSPPNNNRYIHYLRQVGRVIVIPAACISLTACIPKVVPPAGYFSPESGSRLTSTPADVSVNRLEKVIVCYTLDGKNPALANDKCTVGSALVGGKVNLSKCGKQQLKLTWKDQAGLFTTTGEFVVATPNCGPELDTDKDGIPDDSDNCPAQANPEQADLDRDGKGDVCDSDDDGDGVPDETDNCRTVANKDQKDTDKDGIGDACDSVIDSDKDGIPDNQDNCAFNANPNQADLDKDGQGDVCDGDDDGDGAPDNTDNCPLIANRDQKDTDKDGIGDVCDTLTDSDRDGIADDKDNCPNISNRDQADFDGDKIGDACDAPEFHLLRLNSDQKCFRAENNKDVETATCSRTDRFQQWKITDLGSGKFQFRNIGHNLCMNKYRVIGIPWVDVRECNAGSGDMQWRLLLTGVNAQHPVQMQNVEFDFCIYTGEATGTWKNCGLPDANRRSIGIYPDGNFAAKPFDGK